MNKRMILSGGMLVFMAAIVAGGTGAFFSDTETSVGNVFTAGSVSIDLLDVEHDYYGNDNNAPVFDWMGGQGRFTLDDLKPLDTGMLDLDLVNGANEAHVCAMITGNPGDLVDVNDIALYDQLNFFQDDGTQVVPGTWFDLGIANPNGPVGTGVDYCFGEANVDGTGLVSCDYGDGSIEYNDAQNGSFAADLMFYAIQTRNNSGFTCDQLTTENGEPVYTPADAADHLPLVTAVQGATDSAGVLGAADSDSALAWTPVDAGNLAGTAVEEALGTGFTSAYVLEVTAEDPIGDLASLEVDHSLEGTLPEFTLYADEADPYGGVASDYNAAGVYVDYDQTGNTGTWTMYFVTDVSTAADAIEDNEGIDFYLVLEDMVGSSWGSMFGSTFVPDSPDSDGAYFGTKNTFKFSTTN